MTWVQELWPYGFLESKGSSSRSFQFFALESPVSYIGECFDPNSRSMSRLSSTQKSLVQSWRRTSHAAALFLFPVGFQEGEGSCHWRPLAKAKGVQASSGLL